MACRSAGSLARACPKWLPNCGSTKASPRWSRNIARPTCTSGNASHSTTDERGIATCCTPLAREVEQAVRVAAPEVVRCACARCRSERQASPRNSRVLDVVLVEPNEWWFGYHRAASPPARWPGGMIPVVMPDHAVSRAYAKMQEALAWSGLPIEAGDECVEIGCAPGGASQALLDRGLFVTGIDPADVDEAVVASPRFRHLRKRGQEVRRHEFQGVRWLAADMNIAPQDALAEVESIVTHPGLVDPRADPHAQAGRLGPGPEAARVCRAHSRLGLSRRADAPVDHGRPRDLRGSLAPQGALGGSVASAPPKTAQPSARASSGGAN